VDSADATGFIAALAAVSVGGTAVFFTIFLPRFAAGDKAVDVAFLTGIALGAAFFAGFAFAAAFWFFEIGFFAAFAGLRVEVELGDVFFLAAVFFTVFRALLEEPVWVFFFAAMDSPLS